MSTSPLRVVPAASSQRPSALSTIVPITSIQARDREWLLPGRIQQGTVVILEGDPGSGKSSWLAELVATVTTGQGQLRDTRTRPRGVLWLTADEDPATMIRPRLERARADLHRVSVVEADEDSGAERITIPASTRTLTDAARNLDLGLIILDPLASYIGAEVDLVNESQVRHMLDPVVRMCQIMRCVLVIVRQLRKDRTGPRLTHGLGGMAIAAVARTVIQIDRPDAGMDRRILRCIKWPAGSAPRPIEYQLRVGDGAPYMDGVRELTREQDDAEGDLVDVGERSVREDARQLLLTVLERDWVSCPTIMKLAESAGIGLRTLQKVKAELRIASKRHGGGVDSYLEWGPPGSMDPPPSPPPCGVSPGASRRSKGAKSRKKGGSGTPGDTPQ